MTHYSTKKSHTCFFEYNMALSENGHNYRIYEALQEDDLSEVVINAMSILESTTDLDFTKQSKSENISNAFRNKGNKYYSDQRFRKALESYNKALLYAPDNSEAMKLAYSNRSALLFSVRAYTACINDIETCFSMGCMDYKLGQRLKQRKSECLRHTWAENMQNSAGAFINNFFKFNVKRHPQIPCASTDIEVTNEFGMPKIVAAKDIPIGRLVAVEDPFVCELDEDNYNISCHYCHKLYLNLIPCDGCCTALFCNEQCKRNCKKEYHNTECKIMITQRGYSVSQNMGFTSTLKLRAAIKMRQMCKSWKQFITASYSIGEDRMRTSSTSDVYDVKSKFSLLSSNNRSHFIHGERYNQSFICGMDIHALEKLTSFFPKEADERDAAIRAFARVMMHLYSSYRNTESFNAAKDVSTGNVTTNTEHNYGWYSFTGKLKHSCDANLLLLGILNKAALIAIRSIKKGDELTISYLGHYCEHIPKNRPHRLFRMTQEICQCQVCVENWNTRNFRKLKLTSNQKKAYKEWAAVERKLIILDREVNVFKATCEGLTALQGAECTSEHHDMYKAFRQTTAFCQFVAANNKFIEKDDEEIEVVER